MSAKDPFEQRRRRQVVAGASITAVVLAAVLSKAVLTVGAQAAGERAWRDSDHVAAARWFGLNTNLNLVQRWIAPYNIGVAAHSRGRWSEAVDAFTAATEVAPDSVICRIALNHALSLERWGDALKDADDLSGARTRYREAEQVLAEAENCSAEGSDGTDGTDGSDQSEQESEKGESSTSESEGSQGEEGESQDGQEGEKGEEGQKGQKGQEGEEGQKGQDGQDSQDSQDSDAPGEGQGSSEQQQVEDAVQRLRQKMSGSPGNSSAKPASEPDPQKQAEQLAERTGRGSSQRQVEQDERQRESTGGRNTGGDARTW